MTEEKTTVKKLFAWLTALILLVQAVPFAAIAEESEVSGLVTATELTAALSLVGYGENAPAWHDGMQVNGDLTAAQLIQFLQDVQDKRIHTLQNSYTDIENELTLLKTEDPSAYTALTTGENAGMEEYAHTLYRKMEGTRLQLDCWQTTLENQSTAILDNSEKLEYPEEYTDYELRLWSCRIREATEEIRTVRTEIATEAESCLEQLDLQIGLLGGKAVDPARVGALAGDYLLDELGRDRLDVGAVGQAGISHDGGGVAVDQHDPIALVAQHLAGLGSRVVELAGLADDDGAASDDEDGLDVGSLGHVRTSILPGGPGLCRCPGSPRARP